MTHTEIFTLILAGILAAAITVMVVAAMYYEHPEARKARVRATNQAYRTAPEDDEPAEVVGSSSAIPVDPENMPRMVTYNPRPGAPRRSCDCHGTALTPGQKVLWWPRVDVPNAVYVFCEEVGSE